MNHLILCCVFLITNLFGCQEGDKVMEKESQKLAIKKIKNIAATGKSILDLIEIENERWILKYPKNNAMVDDYVKKMREYREFFNAMNVFNFVSKTGSVLEQDEFKGLLIEYLARPEWTELYTMKFSLEQLKYVLWQLLSSMEKFNDLTLGSCVLHQENLFINKEMHIKYIDRDDVECQIGLSRSSNEKSDLIALNTIISHGDFIKNNSVHKQYIDHVKQVIEKALSASEALKKLNLRYNSKYINNLPSDARNKLISLIETLRKSFNQKRNDSLSYPHLDSVIEVLIKNGVTQFDKPALAQFYKELIILAHDNSKKAEDDFSYVIGHGELESGYNYYTSSPHPDELLIRDKWLEAFKAMPLEWAQ